MTGTESNAVLRAKEVKPLNQFTKQVAEDKEDKSMLNSKLQLTKRERVLLELIMLSPIFIVFTVLYTTHNFILTLFLFHVALTVFPLMFLKKKNIHINWKSLLKADLAKNTRNLKNDVKLMAAPAIALTVVYIAYRNVFPEYSTERFRLPSINDHFTALLLIIEFIIINPIVEELFWRFFADLFTGRGKTFAHKLDACFHFGFYHWFVAFFLCQDPLLSTGGFIGVFSLGFILSYVKEKYGLITAMIIHVGVDLAAGIVIVDMQSKFLPFY